MRLSDSEERFSVLGLCVKSNFVAGAKICLEANKSQIDSFCAEISGTDFLIFFLFF